MSKTIVKSVLGLLIVDGKAALVKRRDIPLWVIPGGGIDEGETPEEAICREIKEETGFEAKVDRKVALYTSTSRFIRPVYLFALSPISNKSDSYCTQEVKELGFFTPDNLPYALVPFYSEWIKDTFANKPYFEKCITSITLPFKIKCILSHPILVFRYLMMRAGLHINT